MYRIVYENNGISLYEGNKWILSNSTDTKEVIATRSAIEALLKHLEAQYEIEY